MATEQTYNGSGPSDDNRTTFPITFPYLTHADIKVSVGGQTKTVDSDYTISGDTVTFTTAPATGTDNVKLYRNTDIDNPEHEYAAGSSITAAKLNENQRQALYAIEEAKLVTTTSGGITTGEKNDIHVNSDTDWVIRTGVIEKSMMADNSVGTDEIEANAVTADEIATNAVGADELANNAVDTNAVQDDAVTYPKLQNIVTANRVLGRASAGEVQEVQVVTDMIANTAVTKDKIANTAIDRDRLHISGPATAGHILTYSSGSPGLTWATPNPTGSIIETISYNCDGVSFTHGGVTYNSTAVSAAQTLTTSYADITGSTIAYTPPSGTTKVIYEFRFVEGRTGSTGCLFHMKMFLDSDEVTKARYTKLGEGGSMHVIKWTFPIGGSADTTTGRVATWTSSKTIKLQARNYNTDSYKSKFHETTYWDGNYGSHLSLPTLTLTAIA